MIPPPDELGNVDMTKCWCVFIDMSAIDPGVVTFPGGASAFDDIYNTLATSSLLRITQRKFSLTPETFAFECTGVVSNIIKNNATGGWLVKKYTLYFGDNAAPIIVDVVADTITLDPDWVKPNPTVTAATPGTAGQFAVSDGAGGITWKTLFEVEGVEY